MWFILPKYALRRLVCARPLVSADERKAGEQWKMAVFSLSLRARSQTIDLIGVNCQNWPIKGYTRSWHTETRHWKQWLFTIYKNGTRLFESFQRKISGSNVTAENVVPFFRTECSKRIFVFHFSKAIFDTSFRPSRLFFGNWNWFVQMVNAIPGGNLPVLNSGYLLPKPWTDRSAHIYGKQSMLTGSIFKTRLSPAPMRFFRATFLDAFSQPTWSMEQTMKSGFGKNRMFRKLLKHTLSCTCIFSGIYQTTEDKGAP